MKVIEILNFNRELLKRLQAAGIRLEDARPSYRLYGGEKLPFALPPPLPEQSAAANGCFYSMC